MNFQTVLMGKTNTLLEDSLRFIQETLPRLVVATWYWFRVLIEPFKFMFQFQQQLVSISESFSDRNMCHTTSFKKEQTTTIKVLCKNPFC